MNKKLNDRMPNFSVKMGFGLHWGYAIEGAIGSVFKIDASYLSPNVNMASRLEAATKQFGVSLLISGDLFEICTPVTQSHLRLIDRVTVKGSIEPIDFYTCDLDYACLSERVSKCEYDLLNSIKLSRNEKKRVKISRRIKKNELQNDIKEQKVIASNFFSIDPELKAMRSSFTHVK